MIVEYAPSVLFYGISCYLLYKLHIYIKAQNSNVLPKGCLPYIDIGYIVHIVYLIEFGIKTHWWIAFIIFLIGGVLVTLFDLIIKGKWFLNLSTIGMPICIVLMFLFLL